MLFLSTTKKETKTHSPKVIVFIKKTLVNHNINTNGTDNKDERDKKLQK